MRSVISFDPLLCWFSISKCLISANVKRQRDATQKVREWDDTNILWLCFKLVLHSFIRSIRARKKINSERGLKSRANENKMNETRSDNKAQHEIINYYWKTIGLWHEISISAFIERIASDVIARSSPFPLFSRRLLLFRVKKTLEMLLAAAQNCEWLQHFRPLSRFSFFLGSSICVYRAIMCHDVLIIAIITVQFLSFAMHIIASTRRIGLSRSSLCLGCCCCVLFANSLLLLSLIIFFALSFVIFARQNYICVCA